MPVDRRIYGVFTSLGDYQCPIDGSVSVDEEDIVVSISAGGMTIDDLEGGIEFEFEGKDGNIYYDEWF